VKRFLLLTAAVSLATAGAAPHVRRNDIPPRLQWEANGGYCGETAFISAGLYYGQYLSQYDARVCAIGRTPQNRGELLLGRNDLRAARAMRLHAVEWDLLRQKDTDQFLLWIKRHVARGFPVIIGVYDNGDRLGTPGVSDQQYDHIVPVVRIESQRRLGLRRVFATDHLTFSDNGLYGLGRNRPYLFTRSFAGFPKSREQVRGARGPLYGLPDYGQNYGVVITGVADRDGDTLPVRVRTSKNYEAPAMPRGGTARPAPMPLTLTITVSHLLPGVNYRLYRYDRLDAIPDARFNARAAKAAQAWDIRIDSGSAFTLTQDILSDQVAAYRCVRADAP
jgi:hypothetical protein